MMMLPVMGLGAGETPKLKQHLDVKIKPGWQYVEAKKTFVSSDGQEFSPAKDLPPNTRIFYMAPELARTDSQILSADEQNLARYVQVIFGEKIKLEHYLDIIREWPCVDQVRLPPEVSLP